MPDTLNSMAADAVFAKNGPARIGIPWTCWQTRSVGVHHRLPIGRWRWAEHCSSLFADLGIWIPPESLNRCLPQHAGRQLLSRNRIQDERRPTTIPDRSRHHAWPNRVRC
jgi:hypothetical protein